MTEFIVAKLLKRFDQSDRSLKLNKMIEDEINSYFCNNRHLNDAHLTKIEVKLKRILLAEKSTNKVVSLSLASGFLKSVYKIKPRDVERERRSAKGLRRRGLRPQSRVTSEPSDGSYQPA